MVTNCAHPTQVGYEFEQYYGFFPGYPMAMRLVADVALLPLSPLVTLHTRCVD